MAISDHRKFLPINTTPTATTTSSSCYAVCSPNGCSIYCSISSPSPPLPPLPPLPLLPPLPPLPPPPTSSKHQIHPALFVTVGLLGAFFVLFTCLFMVVKYCPCCRRGSSRSTRSALSQDDARSGHSVDDDDDDDDHGPVMDNPFWYINTVGLDRSVINSIAMFKYKTGDGLVEGTDCSVCLGEFRDDETLRLLPKCSHAFHVSCIDTWLTSHTNCPLCRARIVSATSTATSTNPNPNPVGSSSAATATGAVVVDSEETPIGDDEVEICDRPVEELGDDDDDDDDDDREKEGMPMPMALSESGLRVLSDLAENLRGLESGVKKPVRRSVSMDFSSVSILCFNKNSLMVEAQGGSSTAAQSNTNTNTNTNNLVIDHKRSGGTGGIGNPFFMRLKGSSSIGRTLQKSPLSMKRSVSVSVSWRHSRNRSFLLPL